MKIEVKKFNFSFRLESFIIRSMASTKETSEKSDGKKKSEEVRKDDKTDKNEKQEKSNDFIPEIGIVFHWGLYSVPAFDKISYQRRNGGNGCEWYERRLLQDPKGYRPVSGFKETQEYHKTHYGDAKYSDFAKDFKAEKWSPDEWMKTVKNMGGTKAILTAKHHDGFCLWDTKTTSYNSCATGAKRDLLKEFKEACQRHGLKFGVYYSWMEFTHTCTINFMNTVVVPQVQELMKYKPDIWWYDGHWLLNTKYAQNKVLELVRNIRKEAELEGRKVQINDRIVKDTSENSKDNKILSELSSYRVFSDRYLPSKPLEGTLWEHIGTIGLSWGRNKQQKKIHYKTGKDLYALYLEVKEKKGNLLLNLGPNADGTLDEEEVLSLNEFGSIMLQNKS